MGKVFDENKDHDRANSLLLDFRNSKETTIPNDVNFFERKRYFVMCLMFVGFTLSVMLGANLSICIVDTTSTRTIIIENVTITKEPEFNWTSTEIGIILGAMSWGQVACPLGAMLALQFGGVNIFGLGLMLYGLFTIITPIFMKWNVLVFIFCRIIEGVFTSLVIASSTEIYVQWVPPTERSRLVALASAGFLFGFAISFPLCGFLTFHYGWRNVFYITGIAMLIWCLIWFLSVRNTPECDKFIYKREKRYLVAVNYNDCETEKIIYPWKEILTSKPVWAYVNGRFVESWSLSFMMLSLPLYYKDAYGTDVQDIGFKSGLPHILGVTSLISVGFISDYFRVNNIMTNTNVHKCFVMVTQISSTILLLVAALWDNSFVCSVCFCLYRFFSNFEYVSFSVLPVDTASKYASLVSGMGSTAMASGAILSPIVMGLIVTDHKISQWSTYFFVLSLINVWGGITFLKFGSGELQPWALSTTKIVDQYTNNNSKLKIIRK